MGWTGGLISVLLLIGLSYGLYRFIWLRWAVGIGGVLTVGVVLWIQHQDALQQQNRAAEELRQRRLLTTEDVELALESVDIVENRPANGLSDWVINGGSNASKFQVSGRIHNKSTEYHLLGFSVKIVFMDCESSFEGRPEDTKPWEYFRDQCVVIGEAEPWITVDVPPSQARDFEERVSAPFMEPKHHRTVTSSVTSVRAIEEESRAIKSEQTSWTGHR